MMQDNYFYQKPLELSNEMGFYKITDNNDIINYVGFLYTMENTMAQELQDFPVVVGIPVAWGEMDSFGHVNNSIYFRYFETARIEYLERAGLIGVMKKSGIGPILARTSCTYVQPLVFPDSVSVGARTSSIGNSHFVMEYVVVSQKVGRVAHGDAVIVTFDYGRGEKARVPDDVIRAIEGLEGCAPGSRCVIEEIDWEGKG
jgi:acyl-CoA thioester hydrolase